jgi:hypothetical protein
MSNPNVFDNDVTIQKRLFVRGSSVMTGDVYNLSDTEIRGRTFVQQDTYLYKNLIVAGQTSVKDLSVTGFFSANYPSESIPASAIAGINNFTADVSMNNSLVVGGNI